MLLLSSFYANTGGTNFSPTFNGAQNPAVIGGSRADYEYSGLGPGSSGADANTDITVENSVSDTVINVIGAQSGTPTDVGSFAQADTDIFNLNERADTVRIRLVSATATDTDPTNYPSSAVQIGTFTDDTDFDPANGVPVGYRADCSVLSSNPPGNPPTTAEVGYMVLVVEFTFKKAGFSDLVVTYKIIARAQSESNDAS